MKEQSTSLVDHEKMLRDYLISLKHDTAMGQATIVRIEPFSMDEIDGHAFGGYIEQDAVVFNHDLCTELIVKANPSNHLVHRGDVEYTRLSLTYRADEPVFKHQVYALKKNVNGMVTVKNTRYTLTGDDHDCFFKGEVSYMRDHEIEARIHAFVEVRKTRRQSTTL